MAEFTKKYDFNGVISKVTFLLFLSGNICMALQLEGTLVGEPGLYPLLPVFMLLLAALLAFRFGRLRPVFPDPLRLHQS